ncbi:hypothetical protein [Rubrivirga sp.]|uniref:hypothetical protein n=1 Tax=Rubrivirga sp. TaxID=1885344 RepID=UPI003C7366AC
MDTDNLRLILEAVEQISTELFFLFLLRILEDFVTQMTFYVILMIFAYKCFALASAHLTIKRMGDKLGYHWPYSKAEKRRLYKIFDRGIEEDPALSSDRTETLYASAE